jgi:hypothetical protein
MIDMSNNIDIYVHTPSTGINKDASAVFLTFGTMTRNQVNIGKQHTVAMTTEDAMWLLKHLQYIRERFNLQLPSSAPIVSLLIFPVAIWTSL